MVFKKIGDPMPIKSIYKVAEGEEIICEQCGMPMIVIAFDEDDNVQVKCTCENPDLE